MYPRRVPLHPERSASNLTRLGREVSRLQWQQGKPFVNAGEVALLVVVAIGGASYLDMVEESNQKKCR